MSTQRKKIDCVSRTGLHSAAARYFRSERLEPKSIKVAFRAPIVKKSRNLFANFVNYEL